MGGRPAGHAGPLLVAAVIVAIGGLPWPRFAVLVLPAIASFVLLLVARTCAETFIRPVPGTPAPVEGGDPPAAMGSPGAVHHEEMARCEFLGPLETERLVLRPQQLSDAQVFHRLWTERDPRVPLHRQIVNGRPTVDDIAAGITEADPQAVGPRLLTVVLRNGRDVIGYCGLNGHGNGSADEPELAFELLRRAHGHGYATEAGHAVVTAAADAGYRRLWAGVWGWNRASRRVLGKLGFREVRRIEPSSPHGHSVLTMREL